MRWCGWNGQETKRQKTGDKEGGESGMRGEMRNEGKEVWKNGRMDGCVKMKRKRGE